MIELIKPEVANFARHCIEHGATITDLVIPTEDPLWPGLCNPSIYNDNGQLKLVLRNVNYVMHSSTKEYHNWSDWGPLHYIIPSEDWDGCHLRTRNYICELNEDCSIKSYNLVNTSKYDKKPKWEFVGHEDARLVRWDDKLYMTGVRRDDNTTGVGRMSLCCIDNKYNEISRKKIDNPSFGYCEKNWMAIIDMPYCYIRTTHPVTEIIKVDPKTGKCSVVKSVNQNVELSHDMMIRGSSQAIPWKDGKHIALTHTCNLWTNELDKKVSRYHFQFVVWDADWNIETISPLFTFNDWNIEFSNGLALKDGNFYIPFALQDNMAFLMTVNESVIESFVYGTPINKTVDMIDHNMIHDIFLNPNNVDNLIALANHYYQINFKAGSYCLGQHVLDVADDSVDLYNITFWVARSMADLGHRDPTEFEWWWRLIDLNPDRPEGWMAIHMYFKYRHDINNSYHFAKLAYERRHLGQIYYNSDLYEIEYISSMLSTSHRDEALKYIEENRDNELLVNVTNQILGQQFQNSRIL